MSSVYTVTQINAYIRNMFTQDILLGRVYVKGEVSNCKYHGSGHIYFTLKDERAAISCVMFAGSRKGLAFRLSDGQQVIVFGSVNVYERGGSYQLYASQIRLDGLGVLYERYEQLKKELSEMGMFDPAYKQPIPKHVRTLGVVTAPTGAAVRDIIQIAKRRHPGIRILLYPAKVQGEGAAESVAEGIRVMDRAGVDVVIIGRGGGSIEDLWAFNEEIVARAVFECRTPVISAVGHETDTVISDYVADQRAPTPSAAAELAVEDVRQTLLMLEQSAQRLTTAMDRLLEGRRHKLQLYLLRLKSLAPDHKVALWNERRAVLKDRLMTAMSARLLAAHARIPDTGKALTVSMDAKVALVRSRYSILEQRLHGLSPYDRLGQGFALVTDEQGHRVSAVGQVAEGKRIRIWLSDGTVDAAVLEIRKETT